MNKTFKYFVDTTFRSKSRAGTAARVLFPVILFSGAFALLFAGDFRKKNFEVSKEPKPRPTHEQLSQVRKEKAVENADGKIELLDEHIEMKSARSGKTDSLIKRSAILSHGKYWTIVPKGSVINVPKHLASRVNAERKGKLIVWKDFLAKNRGWLQPLNVDISQARGDKPLGEEVEKVFQRSGRVVVAVCQSGPISVRVPEASETKLADANAKASAIKPGESKARLK